jgi:DegV family protein with EDD domain
MHNMSFVLFADSGCNLPQRKLHELDIHIISFAYEMDGELSLSPEYPDGFDGHSYYERLRHGSMVKTSLINSEGFLSAFRPFVAAGNDLMYVGISSGISGTIQSATIAAQQLMEEYPQQHVQIVDSMGAGLGTGILTCKAADYRNEGKTVDEAAELLNVDREGLCEYFTVDNLMFLKRTGRVSGVTAALGSMLQIKPMLRGDEEGKIVVCGKIRGRKKAIAELSAMYEKKVVDAGSQRVAISHGDCLEEAHLLAERIKEIAPPKELILSMHEPLTGAHVGPGMLAVFFFGDGR